MSFEDLPSNQEKSSISIPSRLEKVDGSHAELRISLAEDGKTKAIAFFDIDKTLAHLTSIHTQAIGTLFPDADPELAETYFKGFKLGNSYREFDRMHGIYVDGHTAWKDPEVYISERLKLYGAEIDEAGNEAHETAAQYLAQYGEAASAIADSVYQTKPEEFEQAKIEPIFVLAEYYKRLGVGMVGMTANADVFVKKLAKYLGLADLFIDIATDETMVGGGKEIAIRHLIEDLISRGIPVATDRLIFVGDSLRGDIGSGAKFHEYGAYSGKGVLVLENKNELIDIERQINNDPELRKIVDAVDTEAFVLDDVPKNQDGKPSLLSRGRDKFMRKL